MAVYDFSGKVAIVTGAGRPNGLGRAVALALARGGADVVVTELCGVPEPCQGFATPAWEHLRSVAGEIEAMGRRALPVDLDVTREAQVEAMVSQVMNHFGRIDILINNAGVATPMKPVIKTAEQEWQIAFDVMCKGTFLCCKHVVPHMIDRGEGGKVVNVSSQAGKVGQAFWSPYAAAKAAIINFTQSLALELAYYKINVNAICPGIIETTAMGEQVWQEYAKVTRRETSAEEVRRKVLAKVPLRRFATTEEAANLVAFLASSQADYMTGQAVNLTGGQTM